MRLNYAAKKLKLSRFILATELLYGVLGPAESDALTQTQPMNASDIVAAARQETNKLHNPVVDIASEFDQENELINQYAVLNSSSGKTLKHCMEI